MDDDLYKRYLRAFAALLTDELDNTARTLWESRTVWQKSQWRELFVSIHNGNCEETEFANKVRMQVIAERLAE